MPVTYVVSLNAEGLSDLEYLFGRLTFSGNYTVGGDTVTFDLVSAPGVNIPVYRKVSLLKASRPPVIWNINLDGGFIAVLLPQTNATNFLLRIYNSTTGAELAGGAAYPAGLTGAALVHTMELGFRKNL